MLLLLGGMLHLLPAELLARAGLVLPLLYPVALSLTLGVAVVAHNLVAAPRVTGLVRAALVAAAQVKQGQAGLAKARQLLVQPIQVAAVVALAQAAVVEMAARVL